MAQKIWLHSSMACHKSRCNNVRFLTVCMCNMISAQIERLSRVEISGEGICRFDVVNIGRLWSEEIFWVEK